MLFKCRKTVLWFWFFAIITTIPMMFILIYHGLGFADNESNIYEELTLSNSDASTYIPSDYVADDNDIDPGELKHIEIATVQRQYDGMKHYLYPILAKSQSDYKSGNVVIPINLNDNGKIEEPFKDWTFKYIIYGRDGAEVEIYTYSQGFGDNGMCLLNADELDFLSKEKQGRTFGEYYYQMVVTANDSSSNLVSLKSQIMIGPRPAQITFNVDDKFYDGASCVYSKPKATYKIATETSDENILEKDAELIKEIFSNYNSESPNFHYTDSIDITSNQSKDVWGDCRIDGFSQDGCYVEWKENYEYMKDNYIFNFVCLTAQILPRPAYINLYSKEKCYDGSNSVLGFERDNLDKYKFDYEKKGDSRGFIDSEGVEAVDITNLPDALADVKYKGIDVCLDADGSIKDVDVEVDDSFGVNCEWSPKENTLVKNYILNYGCYGSKINPRLVKINMQGKDKIYDGTSEIKELKQDDFGNYLFRIVPNVEEEGTGFINDEGILTVGPCNNFKEHVWFDESNVKYDDNYDEILPISASSDDFFNEQSSWIPKEKTIKTNYKINFGLDGNVINPRPVNIKVRDSKMYDGKIFNRYVNVDDPNELDVDGGWVDNDGITSCKFATKRSEVNKDPGYIYIDKYNYINKAFLGNEDYEESYIQFSDSTVPGNYVFLADVILRILLPEPGKEYGNKSVNEETKLQPYDKVDYSLVWTNVKSEGGFGIEVFCKDLMSVGLRYVSNSAIIKNSTTGSSDKLEPNITKKKDGSCELLWCVDNLHNEAEYGVIEYQLEVTEEAFKLDEVNNSYSYSFDNKTFVDVNSLHNDIVVPPAKKSVFNNLNVDVDKQTIMNHDILEYRLSSKNLSEMQNVNFYFKDYAPEYTTYIEDSATVLTDDYKDDYQVKGSAIEQDPLVWMVRNVKPSDEVVVSFKVRVDIPENISTTEIHNTGDVNFNNNGVVPEDNWFTTNEVVCLYGMLSPIFPINNPPTTGDIVGLSVLLLAVCGTIAGCIFLVRFLKKKKYNILGFVFDKFI